MPKSQFISPEEIRKSGTLSFQDIDLNKYNKTIEEEKANFSNDDFMRIYRDMAYIREFESMLYLIKTTMLNILSICELLQFIEENLIVSVIFFLRT